VISKGAAIRNSDYNNNGVLLLNSLGQFNPRGEVNKTELAYSLVQALGLEKEAREHVGDVTVPYNDERIAIKDSGTIPEAMKGYVQVALNLNILNATFNVKQGPYDLKPTIEAVFLPEQKITRGDYAVAASRYYEAWFAQ
jgi:serine protease AprX